jgi:N-acetylglucosamine-6-phosphate deacetylase
LRHVRPRAAASVTDLSDARRRHGPRDGGVPIIKRDGVGIMPDGKSLASSVVGLDHCVQTFRRLTGVPLVEVIRMATLTPARIAGWDRDLGSIAVGKRADLLMLSSTLEVEAVYRGDPTTGRCGL